MRRERDRSVHGQRDFPTHRCRSDIPISSARSAASGVGHRLHSALHGYARDIVRLIGEWYGRNTIQRAWREFTIGQGREFFGDDVNTELFFSWLFHRWVPDREKGDVVRDERLYGVPPTRAYLDRHASGLGPVLRSYLEVCLTTSPRFYEVLECEPGVGFEARDVLTGNCCAVSESFASTSIMTGDILYAHLIPLGQITLLDAVSPRSFPPHLKRRLLQMCRSLVGSGSDGAELRHLYFRLCGTASAGGPQRRVR